MKDVRYHLVGGQTANVGDNPVRTLDEAGGKAFEGLPDIGLFTRTPAYEHLVDGTGHFRIRGLDELPCTEVLVAFERLAHMTCEELNMVIDEPP